MSLQGCRPSTSMRMVLSGTLLNDCSRYVLPHLVDNFSFDGQVMARKMTAGRPSQTFSIQLSSKRLMLVV